MRADRSLRPLKGTPLSVLYPRLPLDLSGLRQVFRLSGERNKPCKPRAYPICRAIFTRRRVWALRRERERETRRESSPGRAVKTSSSTRAGNARGDHFLLRYYERCHPDYGGDEADPRNGRHALTIERLRLESRERSIPWTCIPRISADCIGILISLGVLLFPRTSSFLTTAAGSQIHVK